MKTNLYIVKLALSTLLFLGTTNVNSQTAKKISQQGTMSVNLFSFEVAADKNTVIVSWATLTETNSDFFTVEKSENALDWNKVCVVKGACHSSNLLNYSSVDANPYSGISYYRLKQTDVNGGNSYSTIILVDMPTIKRQFEVFPNPATTSITITSVDMDEPMNVSIFNRTGKMVKRISGSFASTIIDITDLESGVYMVHTESGTTIERKKLFKD